MKILITALLMTFCLHVNAYQLEEEKPHFDSVNYPALIQKAIDTVKSDKAALQSHNEELKAQYKQIHASDEPKDYYENFINQHPDLSKFNMRIPTRDGVKGMLSELIDSNEQTIKWLGKYERSLQAGNSRLQAKNMRKVGPLTAYKATKIDKYYDLFEDPTDRSIGNRAVLIDNYLYNISGAKNSSSVLFQLKNQTALLDKEAKQY